MDSLALGDVDDIVREIATAVDRPLVVEICAPGLRSAEHRVPLVRYASKDGILQVVATELEGESEAIVALKGLTRLRDFPKAVSAIRDIEKRWIDFYVGLEVLIGMKTVPASFVKWAHPDIWRKLIRPWRQWIVCPP